MKNITIILTMLIFLMPALLTAETISEKKILNQLFAEKRALVKEHIKLSENESTVFWPLYDDYVKTQVYSYNRWTELIRRYSQEHENLSDKIAKEMIDKMLKLQAKDVEIKREYVKKFSKKLPPKIVFEYFLFEEKIDAGFNAAIAEGLPPIK